MLPSLRSRHVLFFVAGFGAAFSIITLWRWIESNRQQTRTSSRKRVIAFGDSITQHGFNNDISGWVSRLADWWTRRVDLLNRGFSGYNSEYGVIAFKSVVVVEKPDLIFIFFGANDAVDSSNDRHISLPKFEQNLRSIIAECKQVQPSIYRLPLFTLIFFSIFVEFAKSKCHHYNASTDLGNGSHSLECRKRTAT